MDTNPKGHVQAPHLTFGNMIADTLAGFGAAYLEKTLGVRTNELRDTDRDAALVLRRLVAITVQDAEANPRRKKRKVVVDTSAGRGGPLPYTRKKARQVMPGGPGPSGGPAPIIEEPYTHAA